MIPRIPHKGDLKRVDSYLGDITSKLDRLASVNANWEKDVTSVMHRYRDLTSQMDRITKAARRAGSTSALQVRQLRNISKELAELPSRWKGVGRFIGTYMVQAFDKLGKSIIAVGLDTFSGGLVSLHKGLYKVWELQERWTKAMGALNMRIGALSPNMQGFTKEARHWEGAIRGLTDNFGEGLQMAQEFVEGFERILPEDELAKWGKLGLGIARGLGLGGQAAGQFLKALYQIDESVDESKETFGNIIANARAAGVSVNMFTKELADSREFVISFGKSAQKSFLQSVAFVRKLGVSLKSLESFTKSTDRFDATTESVSKLNTVFGTTINSLDLMLKQDPGQRFEIIRQQLLGQGKTYEKISRQERELIAETLHLTEEEVAGMLKSGQTLGEFQEAANKEKMKQVSTEKLIQKAQAKTAQTLFAFGAAWDQVTASITQLIRPFTDVLGLTKAGGKETKSFGQVMGAVFGRLNKFIREVAKNDSWKTFMKDLAKDAVKLFKSISKFLTGKNLTEWLDKIVKGGQDFYKIMKGALGVVSDAADKMQPVLKFVLEHIQGILAAWVGLKVAIAGTKMYSLLSSAFNISSLGSIGTGVGTTIGGSIVSGLGAAMAGLGIGALINKFITKPIIDSIYGSQEQINDAWVAAQKKLDTLSGEKAKYEKEDWTFGKRALQAIGMGDQRGMKRIVEQPKVEDEEPSFLKKGEKKKTDYQMQQEYLKKEKSIPTKEPTKKSTDSKVEDKTREIEKESTKSSVGIPTKVEKNVTVKVKPVIDETTGAPAVDYEGDRRRERQREKDYSKKVSDNGIDPTTGVPLVAALNGINSALKDLKDGMRMQNAPRPVAGPTVEKNKVNDVEKSAGATSKQERLERAPVQERLKQEQEATKVREDLLKKEIALSTEHISKGKFADSELLKQLKERGRREEVGDKKLFQLRLVNFLKERALDLDYSGNVEKDFDEALTRGGDAMLDTAAGIRKLISAIEKKMEQGPHLSQGGIVRSPTRALIGENGPEAVVPLKAILGKSQQEPARITREQARELVREVDRDRPKEKKGQDVKVVAGDVYLDSVKVGRHLVRSMMSGE